MLNFECPACEENIEIEGEILPELACDDTSFDCPHCDQEMIIGWTAVVEVRKVTVEYSETVEE